MINGNASGLGRHPSGRNSLAMSDDATDDEYDLNPMAVSDGFRPSDGSSASSQRSMPFAESTTASSYSTAASQTTPTQTIDVSRRPSSITKAHRPHDSLTLRNDGTSATAQSHLIRPAQSGLASGGPGIARVESPYQGPSGPSHPYNMYPQRTLSNATLSTEATTPPSPRLYDGTSGPTHPYDLYTQHTTPIQEAGSQQSIPVGFAAMPGGYQRQLGPDGEDSGGLIGPLGHTEELPPYTRYPPQAYDAKDVVRRPANAVATHAAISGAGGIGIATRNPEFSSTNEDLRRPRSFASARSTFSQASQHEINIAAQDVAEKPRMTKWQRRARKKLWGVIPYWAICLLFVFIIVVASVMAGVLTTILAKENGDDSSEDEPESPAPEEPNPLPSLPSGLPSLATGSFGLPPLTEGPQNSICVNDSTQINTWNCEIPLRTYFMDVSKIPNTSEIGNYEMTLAPIDPPNSKYIWGTLPPNVPEPAQLVLVNDTYEPTRGPAWWLKLTYNKTVIVQEKDFSPDGQSSKRDWTYADYPSDGFGPTQFKQRSRTAMDGDKPWICTWPRTMLEIFIFPSQNSSLAVTTASNAGAPTSTPFPSPNSSDSKSAMANKPYPRMIKFLERRYANISDPAPSCRQVEIFNNGHSDRPVLGDDGKPKVVEILEVDRVRLSQLDGSTPSSNKRSGSGLELTDCGCIWRSA